MPPKKANFRKNRRTRHSPGRTKNTEELPVVSPARKRSVHKVIGDNENDGRSTKKTKDDHDRYCFICHEIGQEQLCSTCQRAYHDECLSLSKKTFNDSQECYQCQLEEKTEEKFKRMPFYKLKELFEKIIRNVAPMENNKLKYISDWPATHDSLVHVMDIERMIDRCRDECDHYVTPIQLLGEFKWILHNCVIVHGENANPTKAAKSVVQKCQFELDDVLDCVDCYQEKDDPDKFLNFCNPPHPIVWAKVKGYPYWPAKCLRVVDGHAHVRFFSTHQSASQIKDCLFMSMKYPSIRGQKKPSGAKFSAAMDEVKEYIKAFENKYGEFPYVPENKNFDYEKGMETMKEIHEKFYAHALKNLERPANRGRTEHRKGFSDDVIDLTEDEEGCSVGIKCSPTLSTLHMTLCNDAIVGTGNNVSDQPDSENFSATYVGHLLPGIQMENADASSSEKTLPDVDVNLPELFSGSNISIENVMSAGALQQVPRVLIVPSHSETAASQVAYPVITSVRQLQKQTENNTIDSSMPSFSVNGSPNLHQSPALSDDPSSNKDDDEIMIIEPSDDTGDESLMIADLVMKLIAVSDPNSTRLVSKVIDRMKEIPLKMHLRGCGFLDPEAVLKNKNSRISYLKEELKIAKENSVKLQDKLKEVEKKLGFVINNVSVKACKKISDLGQQNTELAEDAKKFRGMWEELTKQYKVSTEKLQELEEKFNKSSLQTTNSARSIGIQTDISNSQLESSTEMNADALLNAKLLPFCKRCYRGDALIFCCWNGAWNTNYCSPHCQELDRETHMSSCRNDRIKGKDKRKSALESTSKQCHESETTIKTIQEENYFIQKVITTIPTAPQQAKNEEAGEIKSSTTSITSLSNACSTSTFSSTSQRVRKEEARKIKNCQKLSNTCRTRQRVSVTSNKTMGSHSDTKEHIPKESNEDSDEQPSEKSSINS